MAIQPYHRRTDTCLDVWDRNVSAMQFYQRLGAVIDSEAIGDVLTLEN